MSARLGVTRASGVRPLRTVAVAAALAAVGVAGPVLPARGAAAASPGGPTISLPPPAAVGQAVAMDVTVEVRSAGAAGEGTLAVHLALTRRVVAVDDASGVFTTRSHVAALDLAEAPAGFDVAPLDSLAGSSISQAFAPTGAVLGPPVVDGSQFDAQVTGGRQLAGWLATTAIGFPAGPVAVGESWTSPGRAAIGGGITVPVVHQCRLASVAAGRYTVEISYAAEFVADGTTLGRLAGDVSGRATMVGMLDNPLVLSGRVDQVMDALASTGTAATPLTTTSAITLVGRG